MSGDSQPDPADALLAQALTLPVEKRAPFLDKACSDDPELRARIDSALADFAGGATLIQEPEADQPTQAMPVAASPGAAGDPYKLAGTSVDHYEIQERLGKGGMGVVYKALDTRLHRTVALKFLLLSLSDEPEARERFFSEARSASALDHNNICIVHEFGETGDGKAYIVMPHYAGETLQQKLAAGRLSAEAALDYGIQIASGLSAAHAKGILHRDIKPANVMVTAADPGAEHGTAKILDFGLAKIEGNDLTRTGTTMGTFAYMSPEQAHGERADQRADIWSLGVMLYEMLAGERPFKGDTTAAVLNAVLNEQPVPLTGVDPEIPEELDRAVLKCLEKKKELRYGSVDELLVDLRGFISVSLSRAFSGVVDAAPRAAHPPARRRRVATVVAGAVLVLLALALAVPASRQHLLRPLIGATAPAERLVAVLPFINSLGPSPEHQALVDGLTLSVTSMVARLGTVHGSLSTVPASEILQRGITTIGDARKLFGVDTVLTGSVQEIVSKTEMILNLIDPSRQPPRTLDSRTMGAPLSTALKDRAFDELADLFGLEAELRSGLAGEIGPATSSAAYTLYLQGLGYLQRYEKTGNLEAAIEVLGQAVAEDAQYGPAHAALCEALWQGFHKTGDPAMSSRP